MPSKKYPGGRRPKKYSQATRLLKIFMRLIDVGNKGMTLKEITRYDGGRCERTAKRDIEALQVAGVPVVHGYRSSGIRFWFIKK